MRSAEKVYVLWALETLVQQGLAHWSLSPKGLRRLHFASGEIYELGSVVVRRMK